MFALTEVDCLFEHPKVAEELFGLLRGWDAPEEIRVHLIIDKSHTVLISYEYTWLSRMDALRSNQNFAVEASLP